MDDLISRRAVLDMWRQMICYDRTCHYRDEGRCTETFCDFKLFEYQINHMPSVNPQPCEDAISRQALLDAFGFSEKTRKWGGDHSGYNTMMLYEIQDIIESQPPVNPQEPKTGHWIEQIDHEENCRTLICSNCDRPALHDGDSIWKHKFCPHCGARMVDEQESEDKECTKKI